MPRPVSSLPSGTGGGCQGVPAAEGDGRAPSPAVPRAPSPLRDSATVCGPCVTSFVWGRTESPQLLKCENHWTCSNSADLCFVCMYVFALIRLAFLKVKPIQGLQQTEDGELLRASDVFS